MAFWIVVELIGDKRKWLMFVVITDLNLDNAMIFVRALFETYFNDEDIAYEIERQKEVESK